MMSADERVGLMRVLLVDDEQPARERLRQLLAAHADVEIVGEAEDGLQAAELIATLEPEVVFLDIQMPGASGLDVAASLAARRPLVVFCTAFDQYAVDAFELSATDYLLKPVNRARLAAALERVRQAAGGGGLSRSLASAAREAGLSPTRFLARRGTRYKVVPLADVIAFTFTDGVTRVVTATETLSMQPTLAALGRRLDPARFCQVSRSVLLHLDAVREARPFPDGTGEVLLANGQTIAVSRRRWRTLVDRLEH
jgi:DNA-binding LytR/AlgR family response regulator